MEATAAFFCVVSPPIFVYDDIYEVHNTGMMQVTPLEENEQQGR